MTTLPHISLPVACSIEKSAAQGGEDESTEVEADHAERKVLHRIGREREQTKGERTLLRHKVQQLKEAEQASTSDVGRRILPLEADTFPVAAKHGRTLC